MSPFRSQLSIVRLAAIALLASTRTGAGAAGQLERPDRAQVVFNRDIRPLLSENCFKCHGPDARARQAGLRFDSREGALALLEDGGAAIVPGKRGMSRLMMRVSDERASHRMLPPKENKRLTTQQVELLGRWIDQGAAWQEHWAFIPPRRPPVPAVRNSSWIRDPIDAFILSRLERAGLDLSPEAVVAGKCFKADDLPEVSEKEMKELRKPPPRRPPYRRPVRRNRGGMTKSAGWHTRDLEVGTPNPTSATRGGGWPEATGEHRVEGRGRLSDGGTTQKPRASLPAGIRGAVTK